MSIIKHKISETECFKRYIQDCSDEAWQEYLKAIDDEIDFLIEWEKDIKNRHKN